MENTMEDIYVRIEHPKAGKTAIMISALVFGIGFILCLIIGAAGPDVFTEHGGTKHIVKVEPGGMGIWKATVYSMMPEHRLMWLTLKMERPESGIATNFDLSFHQEMTIQVIGEHDDGSTKILNKHSNHTRTVTCPSEECYCDPILLYYQPYIQYSTYHFEVYFYHPLIINEYQEGQPETLTTEMQLYFMDTNYTTFEMTWSYFFLAITLLVIFFPCYGFFWSLCKLPRSQWSIQQKWLIVLLIGLFFFDNPFLAAEVKYASPGLGNFYIITLSTFLGLLLLFWLVIIDNIRYDSYGNPHGDMSDSHRRQACWFIPKAFLCLAISIVIISTYITMKNIETDDPAYNGITEVNSKSEPYIIATSIFMAAYILWISYLVVSCFRHLKDMLPAYLFLFSLTMFTIFITIIGIFVAAFYPIRSSGIEFLTFFGVYNLYIWVLAIAYTPMGRQGNYDRDDHREGVEFSDNYSI
mmetsp:Transcript_8850/g.11675  ORF Transcript_8850/g.11675 Transcript_8850/m.11675 type:complete len:468 (+) Transcript_8850:272-1675(+)